MSLRGTSIVTLFTGINLVITLLNQVVLAYLFGAGSSMDAFLACGAVPFVILNLAIGDLSYILVPLLMQYDVAGDLKAAIDSCFSAICWLAIVVTFFGFLEHRAILRFTTAGNMPAQTFELAASLAPLMWIIIGLTILGSYLTGLHYFYRRFTVPSVTLALPYLGMIAGGFLGAQLLGIRSVVLGWALGTLLRNIVLYVTLKTAIPELSTNLFHAAARRLMRSLAPLGASLLPFAALPMIDVFWASRLPVGSISYLGYSTRIVIALTSIVVQGVSVVLFPDLSADAKEGRLDNLRHKSSSAITFIFSMIVPLVALVFLVRLPLLTAFLQRGKFTAASSNGVARVLPFYLLGTVWMAMMNIVSRSFYALQDYYTPAKTGLLALVVYAALSGLLIRSYSYLGIGMAYLFFWFVLFSLQTLFLGRRVGKILDWNLVSLLGRVLACALVSIAVVTIVQPFLAHQTGGLLSALFGSAIFCALFFFLADYVFGIRQYRTFAHSITVRLLPRATWLQDKPV